MIHATTTERPTLDLDALFLKSGGHASPEEGLCVMEAVAYFAGKPHSDSPPCVCPIIGAFLRKWNDDLDDAGRQRLKRFIPLVVGTKSTPEVEQQRGWVCMDWMVRVYTPAWLRLAKLNDQATALEALPPIGDIAGLRAAYPAQEDARQKAAASRDASRDASRAASWAASRDASRAASRDASRAASRDASRAASRAASWAASRDASRDAAKGKLTYTEQYNAAYAAAREVLKPVEISLQASAEDLLERMIALGGGQDA